VTYAAEEAQRAAYQGPTHPGELRHYTHPPPYGQHYNAMYPNLDGAEMEHNIAERDRVPSFIYEPPVSTTIHLMGDTGYILYIDQDRVTLAEMVL
jgi:hypothetical protein